MKPIARVAADKQPKSIEFVPKRELDRAQQENDRLRQEIERLKQETERLSRELEAALRTSKRVHGEFIIMRRWASGTTLDNASASGRNPKLGVAQIHQHPVLVDLPPSLHACDEH